MAKKKSGKAAHTLQKRRARVNRILKKYQGHMRWADGSKEEFDKLIAELATLNVKYLQILVNDLTNNPGFQDPNRKLRENVESLILEKTVLK